MGEDLRIEFWERYGHLGLECDERAFDRLRDLILAEAEEMGVTPALPVGRVRSIGIGLPVPPPPTAPRGRRGLEMAAVIVATCLSGVVMIVGLVVVVRWILERFS
jgi:hypothetical protein